MFHASDRLAPLPECQRPALTIGILAAIVAAFLVVRVPLMFRQPGGQDEDYYAVPGWTILQTGVPRIPYVPSRDLRGVFYRADEALLALPPAYFYWQAIVYGVIGPGYGQGRFASALAGLAAIGLVYRLGRCLLGAEGPALWAAGLYSLARIFFFPATFARPDMFCAAACLAAMLFAWQWWVTGAARRLVLAGAFAGLGLLTHPFAAVACGQLGLIALARRDSWFGRLRSMVAAGLAASTVFALWLLLIVPYHSIFVVQFPNNVWARVGPGLVERAIFPFESFRTQAALLLEHAGPWQVTLVALALGCMTLTNLVSGGPGHRFLLFLAWSSVLLLVLLQGTHPAKGYWCYPGAFLFLTVARMQQRLAMILMMLPRPGAFLGRALLAAGLIGIFIPGSGLRAWKEHYAHWSDPNYDARRIAQRMLRDLPADAAYLVDVSYVLDFYLAGRSTTLALNIDPYFRAAGRHYDYLIVGRTGLEQKLPRDLDGHLLRRYGLATDTLAAYAEVYSD